MTLALAGLRAVGALALAGALLAGCVDAGPPLTLAPSVDLQRYSGRWYIIANIPYFAERGKVGSFFDVSFQNGAVRDVYWGRDTFTTPYGAFTMNGYVVPDQRGALWRESPFWPVFLSYPILYVDPDYRFALVGYPGREYGWVLSRSPEIDDPTYRALLARFAAQNYDVSRFRRVPQSPGQIGQPGFQ
ncbi:MAG: lipocalin family protein [Alphaproteobacteria bacterium]|nr:lipocalin family protein [Alphaproteobacteria bacterium]